MNDTIDFVISTGGGKASYKAEQPGTDAQIIASARAFLEDFCEMEMNEEIPVALMIYDDGQVYRASCFGTILSRQSLQTWIYFRQLHLLFPISEI